MKKYFSTFFALFCFIFVVVCIGASGVDKALSDAFYSDVLRFHIVANSDSVEDQDLKYKVRDGISPMIEEMFGGCMSVDEALLTAKKNKKLLEDAATKILQSCGSGQKVKAFVGIESYPQKVFKGVVFPKGKYLSVRLILGNGDGQNWWCVLFPSFLDAGIKQEDVGEESRKNDSGIEMFGCRVKLKILEYFE